MNLIYVLMFHCCIALVSMFSLTVSFSMKMQLSEGLQDYTDVFFTKTTVSLQCNVYGVDIDNTNTTIYLNDELIFESKEQNKNISGIFLWRDSIENRVSLQMNARIGHSGEYTCRVADNDGGIEEDALLLNVASDSPQCITKCEGTELETRYQLLCYSRVLSGQHLKFEKVNLDGSFSTVINFTSVPLATATVGIFSTVTIHGTSSQIYKCSVRNNNPPSEPQVKRFCLFNLSRTSYTSELHETCEGPTSNLEPTQSVRHSQQATPPWPSNSLTTIPTSVDENVQGGPSVILFIGIPCIILGVIGALFITCFLMNRKLQKHNDNSLTTTEGTSGYQAGYMTSTSFVHVPLDRSKCDEKQSKMTDRYNAEYKESNGNSQPHIYHEVEKDKNLNTLAGDYHEPSNIPTGPYEITDLYPTENERSWSYSSVSSSTSEPNKGHVNTAYEDVDMDQTGGEIVNVIYEGYNEPKGHETPYAVLDPDGEIDSDEENN